MSSLLSINSTAPALAPPPGQTSNFEHPAQSLKPIIIFTMVICLLFSSLALMARAIAQFYLFKRFAMADVAILIAWMSHVVFASLLLACLPYGAGFHQWDVRVEQYKRIEFFLYVSFVLYDFAVAGAKASILLQLNNLFAAHRRTWFWWASWALIVLNVVFYIVLSGFLIFQCNPIAKAWDPRMVGHCVNQDKLLTSSGPFNIVSDFVMFLLPIPGILRLQLPWRRRLGVIGAFAVALFGCVCSAVRVYYSKRLARSGDGTWTIMQNQLWANAEITIGIMIASIFILPRFFRNVRGRNNSSFIYQQRARHTDNNTNDITFEQVPVKGGGHRRSMPPSRRFSGRIRDPFIELVYTERGNSTENLNEEQTLDQDQQQQQHGNAEQVCATSIANGFEGAEGSSSRASSIGEGGILRTVEVEQSEERIGEPRHPEPVAIPGRAL